MGAIVKVVLSLTFLYASLYAYLWVMDKLFYGFGGHI